jgi:methyl-accepting chemotaxis protein
MKLRSKLLIIVVAVFVVFILSAIVYGYKQYTGIRTNTLEETVTGMNANLSEALEAKEATWITNALQIAHNPIIERGMAQGDRESCIALFERYGNAYSEYTEFNNVQIHLIDKNLESFVKSWAPDDYGESLAYSAAYTDVLQRSGKPLVTVEASPKGMRLKGLFPVRYEGRVVGVANFEGGLNSIKRTLEKKDIEFLYLLNNSWLTIAESLSGQPTVGAYTLSQKDVNEDFLAYVTGEFTLEEALDGYLFDSHYLVSARQAKSFNGKEVGIYIIGMHSDIVTATLAQNLSLILTLGLIVVAAFIIMIPAILFALERIVVSPVKLFSQRMDDIASGEGELTGIIEIHSKDEIGALASGFNRFNSTLRSMILHIKNSVAITMNEMETVVTSATETSAAVQEMKANIKSVSASAENLLENMNKSGTRLESVQTDVQDLKNQISSQVSAVEQTSSSAEEIDAQAKSISTTSKKRKEETEMLSQVVADSRSDLQKVQARIDSLTKKTGDMENAVSVISGIAAQTSLLSMNAAIEAAHAGEHGRGFAVVAEEIRKLAETSASNSKSIRETLKQSVEEVHALSNTFENTQGVFSQVEELSTSVKTSFEEIEHTVFELSEGIQEITRSIVEIRDAVSQIDEKSGNINDSSEELIEHNRSNESLVKELNGALSEISVGVEEVSKSALTLDETIRTISDKMKTVEQQVGGFVVEESGKTSPEGEVE